MVVADETTTAMNDATGIENAKTLRNLPPTLHPVVQALCKNVEGKGRDIVMNGLEEEEEGAEIKSGREAEGVLGGIQVGVGV